jgi:hypothetical protein
MITKHTVFMSSNYCLLLNYSLLILALLICTWTKYTFNTVIKYENYLVTRRTALLSHN